MRLRHLIPVFVIAGVALGGGVTARAASDRQKSFSDGATQLRTLWTSDEVAGLPSSIVAHLRSRLDTQQPTAPWWSPGWIGDDGQLLLAQLGEQTRSAWNNALTTQRTLAEGAIAQWNDFASQEGKWLRADVTSSAAQWATQLSASATPAAISALAAAWQTYLAEQQNAVLAAQQQAAVVVAQQAQLASELQSAGGPQAVLTTARQLVAAAASANLDAGNVAALASQLTAQIAANSAAALPTGEQLLSAVSTLRALIALNNQVEAQVRPLLYGVDQAEAERTPNAATLGGQQAAIAAQFRAARTAVQLTAVAATVIGLQGQITAERSRCRQRQGDHHLAVVAGDALLPGRLRCQGNPRHHRPTAVAHADRHVPHLLQDLAVHLHLAVATQLALLLLPEPGELGHGVRGRGLLHPRRAVGEQRLVRTRRRGQPLRRQPWLRPHAKLHHAVGVLVDAGGHPGGHQRLTAARC